MGLSPIEKIMGEYSGFKEPGIGFRYLRHSDILPKIKALSENGFYTPIIAGTSIEGREIFKITVGNGPVKILVWTQMHGDESTATRAIFDLLNFLSSKNENLIKFLLSSLTITFVPMLNPDGAERFTRENALNIDLNRDAKALQCPEAEILQNLRDEINPDFCFNLHDQNRYYSAGKTDLPPAIAFLAPPFNFENSRNDARKKAMQVIVLLNRELQKIIPGKIAKYSDDHEPRAFGDNFSRQNSAVILIESGFYPGDEQKEFIRELNFRTLLTSFFLIAERSFSDIPIDEYELIPENEERFFDLMLKDTEIVLAGKKFKADIGINRSEIAGNGERGFFYIGTIEGVGDLSTFTAHEIIDCRGLTAEPGRIMEIKDPAEVNYPDYGQLFNSGITALLTGSFNPGSAYPQFPYNIVLRREAYAPSIRQDSAADIVLFNETGIKYLIVNGFLIKNCNDKNSIRNGLIFR